MFGTKKYKEGKNKIFNSDNERKKYFAIKNYYSKKNLPTSQIIKLKDKR